MKVHLDFETRSAANLKDVGAWAYSAHPTTDIICAAYCADEGPVVLDTPEDFCFIVPLMLLSKNKDVIFYAHNAFFEQCIWRNVMVAKYGFPEIPIERWRCTAAKAAAMGLPRKLEDVAKVLQLSIAKDMAGQKAMLKLSSPRRGKNAPSLFWEYDDAPETFDTCYEYCKTDVEVERLIDKALPDLNAFEQRVWFLDQKINFKGVKVDVAFVHKIKEFIDKTVEALLAEFRELTGGAIQTPNQHARLSEWLESTGYTLPNLQAATVDSILSKELPENVRRVLEIRRALSKISTSKYDALLDRIDPRDSRIRDILLFCAAITKRWGGLGFQPQNLPRGTVNSDTAIALIMQGDYELFEMLYPDLMSVYSSCIRGALIAS